MWVRSRRRKSIRLNWMTLPDAWNEPQPCCARRAACSNRIVSFKTRKINHSGRLPYKPQFQLQLMALIIELHLLASHPIQPATVLGCPTNWPEQLRVFQQMLIDQMADAVGLGRQTFRAV